MSYEIGQIIFREDDIELNSGRKTMDITVTNMGDRSIQVCSHYHFFEVNTALSFDREKAFGYRLDIPAGVAVRFEPGEDKRVRLVEFAGDKNLYGFMGLTMGCVDDPEVKRKALIKVKEELER